jgi:hypothetical protein
MKYCFSSPAIAGFHQGTKSQRNGLHQDVLHGEISLLFLFPTLNVERRTGNGERRTLLPSYPQLVQTEYSHEHGNHHGPDHQPHDQNDHGLKQGGKGFDGTL